MTNLEMIDKLSQKAGVSKEQAEEALVKANWDILDAMLFIQKQNGTGDVSSSSSYSTYENRDDKAEGNHNYKTTEDGSYNGYIKKVAEFLEDLINKSINNSFVISRNEKKVLSCPVLVFVILTLASVSGFLLILIIGMFFNFKYSFTGTDLGNSKVNSVTDGAFKIVQNFKASLKQ